MKRRTNSTLGLMGLMLTLPLLAQRRVDPPTYQQPQHRDIVLGGNELHQTVACRGGNAVYVQGQQNEVVVEGACRFVRIQGNGNRVSVRGNGPVHVEGNENTVEITDFNTPFSERGEGNRVERRVR